MIIDLSNVSAEPQSEWIKPIKNEDGTFQKVKYTLKIVSVEPDGYDKAGDDRYKMTFKDSQNQTISDNFTISPEARTTWKLKRIAIALNAPEKVTLDMFVDRYILAVVGGYTGTNGKDYAQIESFEYSQLNDKLPPFQEPKSEDEMIAEEAELAF